MRRRKRRRRPGSDRRGNGGGGGGGWGGGGLLVGGGHRSDVPMELSAIAAGIVEAARPLMEIEGDDQVRPYFNLI